MLTRRGFASCALCAISGFIGLDDAQVTRSHGAHAMSLAETAYRARPWRVSCCREAGADRRRAG